ncbi:MAG: IS200/IS605 family transposase [Candidatus Hadarchaeota archaeon]|nr:IS200/IS605 family transposase [Candidatus Hadarchaeota archaeon]
MEYKHSRNQVYLINYHLVWCPKRRKPVLVGGVKRRLEQILKEVAKEKGAEILALEVRPDHLHLFVSMYPQLPVHKLVKTLKGRSSHHLRREFPHLLKLPSLWTNSYFVSTAGNVSNRTIQRYIEEQSRS